MSDLIKPTRNVIASGITNNGPRTAVNLYEFLGWLKKGDIVWPEQDKSNMVSGRVCAGSWKEAQKLVHQRMADLCATNQISEDAYDLSFIAAKELNLPLVEAFV